MTAPPALGRRGGGWVVAQVALMLAVALSALVGLGWPGPLETAAYAVGALILALGLALAGAGAVGLGPALTPFPAPRQGQALKTGGVYARARHPIYGGGILVALGWSAIFASPVGLALTLALALVLELKSRREEAWLEERHAGYRDYRRRTPHRFIPYLW